MDIKIILVGIFLLLAPSSLSLLCAKYNGLIPLNERPSDNKLVKDLRRFIEQDDASNFDLLIQENIVAAELSFDQESILKAYMLYLENIYPGYSNPKLEHTIQKTIQLLPFIQNEGLKFRAWIAIANAYSFLHEYEISYQYASNALSYASASSNEDKIQKIEANLALGLSLAGLDNIVEAYQSYLNTEFLITQLSKDKRAKFTRKLDHQLYLFHNHINNYNDAANIKIRQLRNEELKTPVDSLRIMWLKYEIAYSRIHSENDYPSEHTLNEIIEFTEIKNYHRLQNFTHALYRKFLLDKNDLEAFYNFYHLIAPEEIHQIKKENLVQYYVFQAYFNEYKNRLDSAKFYFDIAESIIPENDNIYFQINFYKRQGEFYLRNNFQSLAKASLLKSLTLSKQTDLTYQLMPIAKELETLALKMGKHEEAYEYQLMYNHLKLESITESHNDLLLKLELKNQKRQTEYIQQQEEETMHKKHSAQFFGIAIAVIVFMIIVAVVGSMKVPHWLIEMMVFFSILSLFELVILYMDHEFHKLTHGEPLKMFIIKVVLISFLYPLHHLVEHSLTTYLKKNDLIIKPASSSIKSYLASLWPWLESKSKDPAKSD